MEQKRGRFSSSSNPMFREQMMKRAAQNTLDGDFIQRGSAARMTVSGAVNKSLILGALLLAGAVVGYSFASPLFMWGGALVGLGIVIFAAFKPEYSATLAPIYAIVEGLFVGAVSYMYAAAFMPGIILQAVTLTLAVLFMMLFSYKAGLIKVTEKFRSGVIMATGAVVIVYVLSFVLSFFGIQIPFLHQGGMIGIGISLVIIGIAALNLLLDFDNFDKGEQYGAPAYMEWYFAMGLMVTLVWLYVEILRLLAILASGD
ncbi:MAG: Bax inhibitor-1/YccA family protein [Bacteroidota bacterium]